MFHLPSSNLKSSVLHFSQFQFFRQTNPPISVRIISIEFLIIYLRRLVGRERGAEGFKERSLDTTKACQAKRTKSRIRKEPLKRRGSMIEVDVSL